MLRFFKKNNSDIQLTYTFIFSFCDYQKRLSRLKGLLTSDIPVQRPHAYPTYFLGLNRWLSAVQFLVEKAQLAASSTILPRRLFKPLPSPFLPHLLLLLLLHWRQKQAFEDETQTDVATQSCSP